MNTKRRLPEGLYFARLIKIVHFDPEQTAAHPNLPTYRCVFRVEEGEFQHCKVNLNLKLEYSRFSEAQVWNSQRLAERLCEVSRSEELDGCVGHVFQIAVSEFVTTVLTKDGEVVETTYSYVNDVCG